jgi:hypothetical protein
MLTRRSRIPAPGDELARTSTREVLTTLLRGRDVLHVVSADDPRDDAALTLHTILSRVCGRLDGVFTHAEDGELLGQVVAGEFYRSPKDVAGSYDVALLPDVTGPHTEVRTLLHDLDTVAFDTLLLTAPADRPDLDDEVPATWRVDGAWTLDSSILVMATRGRDKRIRI